MNETKILPDDPRLTAYALGELDANERAEVEAALRDDPAGRAAVAEIRALAARLDDALAAEPMAGVAAVEKLAPAAIIAGNDTGKLDGGPLWRGLSGKSGKSKLLRFPQLSWIVGGLAAACFALLLAVHDARPAWPRKAGKQYREVKLAEPPPAEAVNPPVAVAAPPVRGAGTNAFAVPTELLEQAKQSEAGRKAFVAPQLAGVPPVTFGIESPAPAGAAVATNGTAGLSQAKLAPAEAEAEAQTWVYPRDDKFVITAQPAPQVAATGANGPAARGYIGETTLAGTRVQTPLSDAASAISVVTPEFLARVRRGGVQQVFSYGGANQFRDEREPNTESYAYRAENDFLSVAEHPLSTFSADVDTASYANVRRLLDHGQKPPVDAVRIEELLNYFPYRYAPPPAKGAPFAAALEVADAPWAPAHRLVRIGLKGREVTAAERGPANLVFLLDVSGSMDMPNKLPLVKESLRLLLGRLRPDDRVAIVTYAGASGLALPSTPVAQAREIADAIGSLHAEGSTNGAMGIQLAYDIAKANFATGGINRVILCTDGDFNVGVTSEGGLVRLIREKAKSDVFLTVLGFGMGNYKDAMLQQLADAGNGNYGYIDTRREAEKLLVEQVNGTLVTIAKDVKLQVEFNPAQVARYRLIGYEKRRLRKEDFNNDKVDAGEIGAGHTVTALYEIVPAGAEDATMGETPAVDPLKYAVTQPPHPKLQVPGAKFQAPDVNELLTLKVRYKEPAGEVSRKLEFPLVDRGGRFEAASADFKFAAAVAEFGMILRDSPHRGAATLADVVRWAEAGAGDDPGGYRAEFIALVKRAEALE